MITIDPGIQGCGVAKWECGKLLGAVYLRRGHFEDCFGQVYKPTYDMAFTLKRNLAYAERIIVEKPQVYQSLPTPPNDLIDLHEMSATFQGLLGRPVEWVYPHTWKGSVQKEIMTARIPKRLSEDELKHVELPSAKGLGHNVWDSIGIGLHILGRLKAERIVAR